MGFLTRTHFHSFEGLLEEQIKDLYDVEHRLVEALPKMAKAANSPSLKRTFEEHLGQTRNHIARLEQIFHTMDSLPYREASEAMKGLINDASDILGAEGNLAIRDAALIAAAQRVEHYEIAGYGSARAFADQLGFTQAVYLLQATLEEESAADKLLTQLATEKINIEAFRTSDQGR